MNISKNDVQAALDALEEGRFGDLYGSDRAVEKYVFDALVERVDELEKVVRYLARDLLSR